MDNESYDHLYKIVIVGDCGVGKTTLVSRFCNDNIDNLDAKLPTMGVDFTCKIVEVDGIKVKLQIWDTAGQERYRSITKSYIRGARGVVLAYDISNKESFENIKKLLIEVRDQIGLTDTIILVGNKTDMNERQVTFDEGKAFADQEKLLFMEASSFTNTNVTGMFMRLADDIYKNHKERYIAKTVNGIISGESMHPNTIKSVGDGCC